MTTTPPVAIVTGAARRIGKAIAEDLAAHGWAVAIHYDRSRNDAEATAAAIRESGMTAVAIQGDLADGNTLPGLLQRVNDALGKPSLLVNNASMFTTDAGGPLDLEQHERQMAVNLTAPIFLSRALAEQLPDETEGNVVNILDQSVWKPTPRHFSYQLSKVGLWEATRMLAQLLGPKVRVNGIAPGPTLRHGAQTEEEFQARIDTIVLKRAPALEEFGRTVRFFIENRSITGQMIGLDGGQHLAWETPDVID
ncbi:SDR family oxidoreductase [Bauldia sp.]|uniref:SDR family oxidoreductase n=1 Tax=Bauldia sp. TaxID=2575872 RepID=UPI003BAA7ACA